MESILETTLAQNNPAIELQPWDASSTENDDDQSPAIDGVGLSHNSKKISKKRSKYQRIDDNLRQKLIDAVVNDGQMLKVAAKKYKINYSSAKSIFHTYRKEGRVNKKTVRDRYVRTSYADPAKENSHMKAYLSPSLSTANSAQKDESVGFIPESAKMLKAEKSGYDPKLSLRECFLSQQTNGISLQNNNNNALLANSLAMHQQSLMQNLMQKAASIKLLQEFTQMQQSLYNPCLPLIPNNFQLNSGSIAAPNYSAIMALQAAQLSQYTKERQMLAQNNTMSLFQGYQDAANNFSLNTSGCNGSEVWTKKVKTCEIISNK